MNVSGTDPLVLLGAATTLLCVSIILPKLRRRLPPGFWVFWRLGVFVTLTLLLLRVVGSPLEPHFTANPAGLKLWEQFIEAAWWVMTAHAIVGLARVFVVLEHRPRETRIVSDLLAGAVYVATLLAVINFAFDVPIRGLLATSGVIAIVLGLALQSTLADVFSGIAVGLERPYQAGDLLWVEGGIEGHVVEVNWRSTHIATVHRNIAIVPNSIIAKSRLINRSQPTPMRADSISVSLDARATPEACVGALHAAMRACRVILAEPPPSIACTGLYGDGVHYEIDFYVEASDRLGAARGELFTQVHRHLRHAGIALAIPNVAAPPDIDMPSLAQLLRQSDLFSVLDNPERELLAGHFTVQWLEPAETLIREGDAPEALFIIAAGAVEITRNQPQGQPRVVYRMSPGESLGVNGLITGAEYPVTATALTPVKAYRLAKDDLAVAIKANPELGTALEALDRRGRAILSRNTTAIEEVAEAEAEQFLPKLRDFLRLLAG